MKFFSIIFIFAISMSISLFSANTPSQNHQVVFIMLGAPGAGKGTQSSSLSQKFKIPQISTGDLFRENLRNNTEIGQRAKVYMDQGQLVPDEVVLDMLFARLTSPDCEKGYILDGFPRTIPQAKALTNRLSATSAQVIVISLEVSDAALIERLSGRLVCEKCGTIYHKVSSPPQIAGVCDHDGTPLVQRADDKEEIIRERLKIFHEQTEPVKEFFESKGNLLLVDSSLSKEITASQIEAHLNSLLP